MNQYWKLPWNPKGYIPEEFILDTTNAKLGDSFRLKYSFYLGDTLSAKLDTGELLVCDTSKGEGVEGVSLLMVDLDPILTSLSGKAIYRNIIVNSKYILNKKIIITCSYTCDAVEPSDFNQILNQSADVTHKSITTQDAYLKNVEVRTLKNTGTAEFSGAKFSQEKGLEITKESLNIKDVSIAQGGIQFPNDEVFLGTKGNYLKFNKDKQAWYKYNQGTEEAVPMVSFYKAENDHSLIPFTTRDNSSLDTEDYFYLDTPDKELNVPRINSAVVECDYIRTNHIQIGKFDISLDVQNNLCIDNNFKIHCDTGEVTIGFITFNQALLLGLSKLLGSI